MGVLDWLLGRSSTPVATPARDPLPVRTDEYPSPEYAGSELGKGVNYGSGNEAFSERGEHLVVPKVLGPAREVVKNLPSAHMRRPGVEEAKTHHTQAQLAANRSAIAGLGYEPRRFGASYGMGPTSLGGFYFPSKDVGWSNASEQPSAVIHESIHRGFQKMMDSGRLSEETYNFVSDPQNDELATRYLMIRVMGDPEIKEGMISLKRLNMQPNMKEGGMAQIEAARFLFESGLDAEKNLNILKDLERTAQEMIAQERKPFGMHR